MAVPAVEAASSDSEAPVKDVLTAAPVMLSSAELYCRVNVPEVMPLPTLTLSGMPPARAVGQIDRIGAVRPTGEGRDADDHRRRGHHEGRDIIAAGRVAVVGAVERVAQAVHEAVGGAAEGDGVGAGRQDAGAGIEVRRR